MTTNTSTMEENKIKRKYFGEDSIKHYCRVCTSNSKMKRTKSEEHYIGIFKKIGLKSILEKFLHLEISEDDQLPKTICKKCFDKLMAIEFLQVIAKRSENLFKDFLRNRSPESVGTIQDSYKSGFIIKSSPTNLGSKPEEVVVDVSMSDPLTKDIQKKLQVAQSKRDSMGMAFSPDHISRNAVTSSPNVQVPVTIVHRMPKKRKVTPITLDAKQIAQIPQPQTNTTTVTLENPPKNKCPPLRPQINPTSPLRHISEGPTIPQNVEIHPVVTGNPHVMGHGMPLGSIIKDVDLLKLILKALKWPYNSQTLDIQIQRLKDTNFNDIIVDPNLLQDTDLIQILGPLLAPLPVVMQQQTYHITIPPETMEVTPTTMSYKLPAETSVQIITVPAAEKESSIRKQRPTKRHINSSVIRKKSGNTHAALQRYSSTVIVVSDESDDDQSLQTPSANEEIHNFGVQLDPAVYPGAGDNSNSNEAMLATLNRQREAMMRMHRSKRKQSLNCARNVEMVDDIMIVDEGFHVDEPYPVKKKPEFYNAPGASISQLKTGKGLTGTENKDLAPPSISAQIKPPHVVLSNPSTYMKSVQCSKEYLKPEKARSEHGFIKLKHDLPPLKKVKLLPKNSSSAQVKEPSKLVNISKNTTVADADSTTKIVIKDTKVPKSSKPSSDFDSKISKFKKAAKVQRSKSICQSNSDVKNQENEKNKKVEVEVEEDDEVIVVLECADECDKAEKQELEEAVSVKIKSAKNTTTTHPETKKKEYRILATFDVSDDEMEPLQVEDSSGEQTINIVDSESSSKLGTESVVLEESPIKTTKKPEPAEIDPSDEKDKETPSFELPAIEIKTEDSEEIEIKKEDIESIDEGQTSKSAGKAQRNFVASKTAFKSEMLKSTRSSAKRKVPQKEEEPAKDTPTNFRPARKSKTLSKYYKGPPLSGIGGRSMRSRT